MSLQNSIEEKLVAAFSPTDLSVENESHKHAGHAGSPGTGDSHFRLHIVSESFSGKSRLERHRLVNDVLAEEIAGPIHALAIQANSPEEV